MLDFSSPFLYTWQVLIQIPWSSFSQVAVCFCFPFHLSVSQEYALSFFYISIFSHSLCPPFRLPSKQYFLKSPSCFHYSQPAQSLHFLPVLKPFDAVMPSSPSFSPSSVISFFCAPGHDSSPITVVSPLHLYDSFTLIIATSLGKLPSSPSATPSLSLPFMLQVSFSLYIYLCQLFPSTCPHAAWFYPVIKSWLIHAEQKVYRPSIQGCHREFWAPWKYNPVGPSSTAQANPAQLQLANLHHPNEASWALNKNTFCAAPENWG